ncbi:uncharacterized protein (TIGR00288 family) [Pseudomonas nitritireducens]|uniref:Uncharacterized protein (TIGR00288 family) n=1 Tax=Pseudomonas nitroreducens TaxID=46680 RepID=A0A7W7KFL5_PSENT|nr:NYN domain-containing protein [Pseudomonas nitritireducens]MBB4861556.1 uncharacterized protein (TIGR00288 family) [Pseudomonas nitritireducens]
MCSRKPNIAVFIDAENIHFGWMDRIYERLARVGVITISRAYGNWAQSNMDCWKGALQEFGIKPVQMPTIAKGKNASDMGLVVDAIDCIYTNPIDIFCIISSDCDFTPLVLRLREKGKRVLGIGTESSARAYRGACNRFITISAKPPRNTRRWSDAKCRAEAKTIQAFRSGYDNSKDTGEGWRSVGEISFWLSKHHPVNPKHLGHEKLVDVLEATGHYQVDRNPTRYRCLAIERA